MQRPILLLILLLSLFLTGHSQIRTITGVLTSDEDGSPLPGVSIFVKGTTNGTVTDIDGYYRIEAEVGSTLVFSFIGFGTKEVLVGPEIPQQKPARIKPFLVESLFDLPSDNTDGVTVLGKNSKRYSVQPRTSLRHRNIRSFKRKGSKYEIVLSEQAPRIALSATSGFSISNAIRLPKLQNSYVQGQSGTMGNQWSGPASNEIYSWGPDIRTLSFDGIAYSYDSRGQLGSIQQGDESATPSDPKDIFRTGFSLFNELNIHVRTVDNESLILNVRDNRKSLIVPGSQASNQIGRLIGKSINLGENVQLNFGLSSNLSKGNLLQNQGFGSVLLGSIYRTPVSFDNPNGIDKPFANEASYLTNNGSPRSHAPNRVLNPYQLLNQPNSDRHSRTMAHGSFDIQAGDNLNITIGSSLEHQSSEKIASTRTDFANYSNGIYSQREGLHQSTQGFLKSEYFIGDYDFRFSYSGRLTVNHLVQEQFRTDIVGPENLESPFRDQANQFTTDFSGSRTFADIYQSVELNYKNEARLLVGVNSYLSSTLTPSSKSRLLPHLTAGIELSDIIRAYDLNQLDIAFTYSQGIKEAPLFWNDWAFETTNRDVDEYQTFIYQPIIPFRSDITPENLEKYHLGVVSSFFNYSVSGEVYLNKTSDAFYPVYDGNEFKIQNIADVTAYGSTITASAYFYPGSLSLFWSKEQNTVTKSIFDSTIPLSGFSTIYSGAAKGKPMGSIFGTDYERNEDGQVIISEDGYPIESSEITYLGNPLPAWTMSLDGNYQWNNFRIKATLMYRHKGSIWDGTQAVLDYLGRSERSGTSRNLANHIFEGVGQNGAPNTLPIQFHNPNESILTNRFVRYGWDGVGSEYVREVSQFMFKTLTFEYSFRDLVSINDLKVSFSVQNPLILSGYRGSDLSSGLFGSPATRGLYLFNLPFQRSYSFQVKLNL